MEVHKIQLTNIPITIYRLSCQRFITKISFLQHNTSPKHLWKNYSRRDMKNQPSLFGFKLLAVVEDVALITLEKTARRLKLPIKSYERLKFQPPIVEILLETALY